MRQGAIKSEKRSFSKWRNYYDVVVLPSSKITSETISLSRKLSRQRSSWKLGRESYIPHISLYHIKIKAKSLKGLLAQVKRIAEETVAKDLSTTNTHWSPSGKFVFLSISKRPWLKRMQTKIADDLVSYFDCSVSPDELWNLSNFSLAHKKTAHKYGTPFVGKTWEPHISLAYFAGEVARPALSGFQMEKQIFIPKYLAVCALGESYSCQKLIARFPLLRIHTNK